MSTHINFKLFYLKQSHLRQNSLEFNFHVRAYRIMCLRSLFALFFFTQAAIASPWMTGPILAPAGRTVPPGHFNFEPYGFYTLYPAQFRNAEVMPVLTVGITNFLDIQTSIPYDYSWDRGQHGEDIGDFNLGFGIQFLRQKEASWIPDLRVTIQEIFPTGRFDNLNPKKLGTDQTGIGAYQTIVGLNFQRLTQLPNEQYLRTRLSLVGAAISGVNVTGVSAFGGGSKTSGSVKPGNGYSADLAFEYSLNQHWVPVFEMLYVNSQATHFSGNPGFTPGGTVESVGGRGGNQASLAPAIEYNFTAQLGIIAGVWFSVTGPHAGEFTSNTIAINYYF